MDVIDRVPGLAENAALVHQRMVDQRNRHWHYVREIGDDMPEVKDWSWPSE
jgi:xylulose-5-phosphate/fructose-6-phosphate phosphoketolase